MDNIRPTLIVIGVIGAIALGGAILYQAHNESTQQYDQSTNEESDDAFYAQMAAAHVTCVKLIMAYNFAMTGDYKGQANGVQNTLWYAKQRILRVHPQSSWAQPQYLEKAAKTVFGLCHEKWVASGDSDSTTIDQEVDEIIQSSPYTEQDLIH